MTPLQILFGLIALGALACELSPSVPTDKAWVKVLLLMLVLAALFAADKAGV